jgi:hypothetical protein
MTSSLPQEQQQQQPSPEETKLTTELASDRPTIDSAVKSFISLIVARSLTASSTDESSSSSATPIGGAFMGIIPTVDNINNNNDKTVSAVAPPSTQQQVLHVARAILKTINSYEFPIHDTVASTMAEKPGLSDDKKQELLELGVVSRLWNGLIQSSQKPSRFFGKRALRVAWPKLNVSANIGPAAGEDDEGAMTIRELQLGWLAEFERLLFSDLQAQPSQITVDDDAALLWASDKGAAELSKRRQRRQDAAKERGPSTPS